MGLCLSLGAGLLKIAQCSTNSPPLSHCIPEPEQTALPGVSELAPGRIQPQSVPGEILSCLLLLLLAPWSKTWEHSMMESKKTGWNRKGKQSACKALCN